MHVKIYPPMLRYFLYFASVMRHLLLLTLLSCIALRAQDPAIPVTLLSEDGSGPQYYVGTDAFGWIYEITDNEFSKRQGTAIVKYRNVALGEITRVDLQNPLQIVLFYRRFNTVVLLDNQLNEIRRIDFSEAPQPLIAEAVGLASQNRLWVFDITTQQIGLYDLAQSNFKPLTPPFADAIHHYRNDYNYFYWIDASGKCFALNLFGKVTGLGAIPEFEQAQLLSEAIVLYSLSGMIYFHRLDTGTDTVLALPEKSFKSFHYAPQILSIFTDSDTIHYKITLPD